MSNPKSCNHEDSEAPESYPAIAYFIVYKESDTCNENVLFTALHNEDIETELTPIRVRTKNATGNEMETAACQLFQVVKDHNNSSIQEMLDASNVYCYQNAGERSTDDELDSDVELTSNHFPNRPCILMAINESDFGTSVSAAVEKLQADGLVVDIGSPRVLNPDNPCFSSTSDVAITIQRIERCIKLCDHALYRSDVYAKPENSTFAYVKIMGVSSYLHKLLANEALHDKLVQHFQAVERHLLHPACEIISQIKFDYDLIEVSNGYCFSIKSRKFIPCPIPDQCVANCRRERSFHTTAPQLRNQSISVKAYTTPSLMMTSALRFLTSSTSACFHLARLRRLRNSLSLAPKTPERHVGRTYSTPLFLLATSFL